jgi:hypothetical protein
VVGQSINADDTQYALPSLPPDQRSNRLREPHDNDFAEGRIAAERDLSWGEAHLSTALVRHRVTSRYDASAAPPIPAPSTMALRRKERFAAEP